MLSKLKSWISRIHLPFKKKYEIVGDLKIYRSEVIKIWAGKPEIWDYTEVIALNPDGYEFSQEQYVGLDVICGVTTGILRIKNVGDTIVFKEWSRDYDGRAPLYFKSTQDFMDQVKSRSGNLDGFYLPF